MFGELLCFPVQVFFLGGSTFWSRFTVLFLHASPESLWVPGRGSLGSREGVEQSENISLPISAQGTACAGREEEEERPGTRKIL